MKTNPRLLLSILGSVLFSAPVLSHHDLKLVIEPALPDSNQIVTISVTDSACFFDSDVTQGSPRPNDFQIRLDFPGSPVYEQCLEEHPDSPNFETTIGPLEPGDYGIGLYKGQEAHIRSLRDTLILSVVEAPPPTTLSEGGINGLYHDLQAPHRYLYVLETDYTTLVVWNTFDPEGNQLWVYGVGDLLNDGSSVVAETYINTSGGFLPNGEADDDVEPWGLIRVDLLSCTEGRVTYQSDLPEFGSGEFSVVRLAYSKQIGCVESE